MKPHLFSYFIRLILFIYCCTILGACGSDEHSPIPSPETALSSLNGHSINFYYEYEGKLYRAMSINVSETGVLKALCYDAKEMLGGDTYSYTKHNENTAYLELLIHYISASEREWEPEHRYQMDLIFASANQGYAEGKDYYTTLYNGLITKVFSKLKWYFMIDSSDLPDKAAIDRFLNQGGSNEGATEYSNALKAKVTSINNYYPRPSIVVGVTKNSTTDLPPSIGFCIGTSPHSTVNNAIICREEASNLLQDNFVTYLGAYTTDPILSNGTTYYIRPYHREGDKTIYYEETVAETMGNNYNLMLIPSLSKIYTISYNIKPKGSYTLQIVYRIHKGNQQDDFYTQTLQTINGGSGNLTWKIADGPYAWEDIHAIWAEFKDNNTGIIYSADSCPGGAGDSCL